ncbi:MAG: hypothetical protein COW00_11975 [Bdellovibrio sp. CG12_big_fil_rev_8_21_14_0_65_39_13]|nr:MAG: hypothetical protein COW78_00770 [Bdellovibrio sp. CG22_combo_CG10-13_8_21_14_all_39_27]PIQ59172.1 MAG: hypothetical protein COW00_11975 [Bdellovibrio sp. CG12_big_fil_rev_8_21_14_0_65_39_13]PIR33312.1 MAG: hypothetical protein COV37_16765 [Bdellovibrio sp. CG11_big_fil_rev_8_21_14_0_20_39_38]
MENNIEEVGKKRRGRHKNQKKEFVIKEEQTKFFVDLSHDKESLDLIFGLLRKCNEKDFGKEILFKDLCLYAVSKLTDKDLEKIQEGSLSEMEKVQRALDEHNKKTCANLSLGEFLVKKLGIN